MPGLIDASPATAILPPVPEGEDIIRSAILAEYKRRKLNPYQLWKLVEDAGVSRATIYAFVREQTTLNTRHAAELMRALGLTIAKPKRRTEN